MNEEMFIDDLTLSICYQLLESWNHINPHKHVTHVCQKTNKCILHILIKNCNKPKHTNIKLMWNVTFFVLNM